VTLRNNLYKDGTLLKNVTDSTNYLDPAGRHQLEVHSEPLFSTAPRVRSLLRSRPGRSSTPVSPDPTCQGSQWRHVQRERWKPGDLDGDGKLDIVMKWDPSNAQDNSNSGTTDDVFIDGYTLAGKQLWRIDLGPNIRAGAHYTQMSVGRLRRRRQGGICLQDRTGNQGMEPARI